MVLLEGDPLAIAVVRAVRGGDLRTLARLLSGNPGLASVRLASNSGVTRTLLHVATEWPGHFPNRADVITALVGAGAQVDARFTGPRAETALHRAASSDDVAALDALLDAGADIEADGAVIGGRTAVSNAVAFRQWNAARRLVERGARTTFSEAAALGLYDRVQAYLTAVPPPDTDAVTAAFWDACHGDQQYIAERLLEHGADLNWIGWDQLTPLDEAIRGDANRLARWLRGKGARTAAEIRAHDAGESAPPEGDPPPRA
jgi:ankyrin repeat protein